MHRRIATTLVLAAALAWVGFTPEARAQPQFQNYVPPELQSRAQPRAVDPLLIAGVSLLPTTAVTLGIGGWLLRPEPTETRCGITGECFDYTPPSGRIARAHGVGFVASGIATGSAGIASIVAGGWLTAHPELEGSGPFVLLGSWLGAIGLGTAAMGAGSLVAARGDLDETREAAVILTTVGGGATIAGVSVLSYGLATRGSGYRARSEGRVSAGIALATIGASVAPVAVTMCGAAGHASGEFAGLVVVVQCLPPAVVSAGLAAGGTLLWALGGRDRRGAELSLATSPGGLALQGIF